MPRDLPVGAVENQSYLQLTITKQFPRTTRIQSKCESGLKGSRASIQFASPEQLSVRGKLLPIPRTILYSKGSAEPGSAPPIWRRKWPKRSLFRHRVLRLPDPSRHRHGSPTDPGLPAPVLNRVETKATLLSTWQGNSRGSSEAIASAAVRWWSIQASQPPIVVVLTCERAWPDRSGDTKSGSAKK